MPAGRAVYLDDHELVRRCMERLLRSAKLDSGTFDHPAAFLTVAKPIEAGCLLLDIRLQGMTNWGHCDRQAVRLQRRGCGRSTADHESHLSPRERQVLDGFMDGHSNKARVCNLGLGDGRSSPRV
jgi:FixJ family two-component response regulator